MPRAPHETTPSPFGLDRIVFFSDAVMAIAITLLVLDIKVPEAAGISTIDLGRRMLDLWPKYLGYFVSFWVIALYWVAHHRCFRYIRKYDRRLMYLNFLFLMFIAFMPFPTGLLFDTPVAYRIGCAVRRHSGGHGAVSGLAMDVRRPSPLHPGEPAEGSDPRHPAEPAPAAPGVPALRGHRSVQPLDRDVLLAPSGSRVPAPPAQRGHAAE